MELVVGLLLYGALVLFLLREVIRSAIRKSAIQASDLVVARLISQGVLSVDSINADTPAGRKLLAMIADRRP